MIKKNKKESLADKISGILSAAPASFDPEDDIATETSAKAIEDFEDVDGDEADDEILLSKFRKDNIDLLADDDDRYAGKKGSRKNFKDSDSESDVDDAKQDDDSVDEEDDDDSSNEDDEEISDESDESDDMDKYGEDFDASMLEEDNFKHIKDSNVTIQMKKGISIRNQLSLWESLLEMRIQLQKCLITSNKLPQYETHKEMKDTVAEFGKKVTATKKTLTGALDKMLELQKLLIKGYPETKGLLKKSKTIEEKPIVDDDDEEIPSDTEEEKSESEEEPEIPTPTKKKRKLEDYENEISEFHKKYKPYRNTVIQKWNEKTRIGVGGKNNSATHSVLNQIEHNLADHAKLIKRTQLKRSEYPIIGYKPPEIEPVEPTHYSTYSGRAPEEYNNEIFDDDDFYHQLLRELIEVKSADLTDPVQLGRQWIQLQNLRSKMKRKIDTKATKGRKIRYAIHSKMVNFMAPNDSSDWTDDAKNELFSSLFGKNQIVHAI